MEPHGSAGARSASRTNAALSAIIPLIMLKMLRAMNRWELAEVCRAAGVPEGARPEEILRALSGAWWAVPWGAVEEERDLLLRAAEALNLMPRLRHHRHRLGLVERLV